jgi:hypothetical protein
MSQSSYNYLQNNYKEYYRCSKEDNRYFYVKQVHLVSMSQNTLPQTENNWYGICKFAL